MSKVLQKPVVATSTAIICLLLIVTLRAAPENDSRAAASRACQWLASQQQPNGAIAFRGRILNPNVWETANALIALIKFDPKQYQDIITKGFAFLDASWVDTGGLPESADRLLGPNKSHCVETTGTAMRAYAAGGKTKQVEALEKFLFSVQEPEGEWKIGYPEAKDFPNGKVLEVFPSVTGFALAGTATDPVDRAKAERGLAWLKAQQKPEGDWGAYPDYFWTPYYATSQIVAGFAGWGHANDPVVKNALKYTRDHQNSDGSWGDAGEPLTPSRELWTGLALRTLEAAPDPQSAAAIQRGVAYLIAHQQPDGRWIGGYFKSIVVPDSEKKEDVYATSLAVVALLDAPKRAADARGR